MDPLTIVRSRDSGWIMKKENHAEKRTVADRRNTGQNGRREIEHLTVKKLFHDYGFKEERVSDNRRRGMDRRKN